MLEGRIVKKRGHFTIDISFTCENGKLLALTGSSGAGKTTVIRALAGLNKPDRGQIVYDKKVWFDGAKIWVPARDRRIGYVFQEHTLFPHLNVEKNVGFSCKNKTRITELLEMLGIRHLALKKPHQISGGERQRAAFAQALASDPQVLLLDEPFSALDAVTRVRLRQELKRLKSQLDIPIVFVTHDLEEASYLADKIVELPCPRTQTQNLKKCGLVSSDYGGNMQVVHSIP